VPTHFTTVSAVEKLECCGQQRMRKYVCHFNTIPHMTAGQTDISRQYNSH